MKAVFHYHAGPRLQAGFDAMTAEGFTVTACAEGDDIRLADLLPQTEVLLHLLKPATRR